MHVDSFQFEIATALLLEKVIQNTSGINITVGLREKL